MKRYMVLVICVVAILFVPLMTSCGGSATKTEEPAEGSTAQSQDDPESAGIRWDTLEWHTAKVNTLGAANVNVSFGFPEDFGGYEETATDQSYVSYGSSTRYGSVEGMYSIVANYFRNSEGPTEESFRAMQGTISEVEINGQKVILNKQQSEETGYYYYGYFVDFHDSVNSRVVIVLTDQEENSGFRSQFERRLWWA